MPKQNSTEAEKNLSLRLLELLQALQVIRDCLRDVECGKQYAILPIGGQVRALLAETSRKNRPLLCDLAQKLKVEPKLYIDAATKPLKDDRSIFHLPGLNPTLSRERANQRSVSIEEFLETCIITISKRHYTVRDVIKFAANKSGGAHYATTVAPRLWLDMCCFFSVGGVQLWQWVLKDIGKAALQLGVLLLQNAANLSLQFGFILCEPVKSGHCRLMVATHHATSMNWSLVLSSDNSLAFTLVGLCGTVCVARSSKDIDWRTARHICVVINICEDLSTKIRLLVDSMLVGEANIRKCPDNC